MDENFRRANLIGAVTDQKFYFRTNIFDSGKPQFDELYLKEIFMGNEKFVGLNSIIQDFIKINEEKLKSESAEFGSCPIMQINATFDYLLKLSTGEIRTNAKVIRDFITHHSEYKKDSHATEVSSTPLFVQFYNSQLEYAEWSHNLLVEYPK